MNSLACQPLFIYIVSSLGVTGMRREIKTDLESIVGSAIIKLMEKHGREAVKYVGEYVKQMKEAVS